MSTNDAHIADDAPRLCPQCERTMTSRYCNQCRTSTVLAAVVHGASAEPEHSGRILAGQYELLAELGKGGMGTVYSGVQMSVDRPVAIKLISSEIASDLAAIKRFQIEAKLTSRLNHPNCIRLYDFGVTDDGLLYLVMEMLKGRELADEIAAIGAMPPRMSLDITLQVLAALREAHSHGIVHRDLKPANLFVTDGPDGAVVKVMDFGIAKLVQGGDSKVTKTGMLVGTPAYMSPEQARGEEIDHRSDFYSLGIILYEMLTGMVPFQAETPVSVLLMHVTRQPDGLVARRPDRPTLGLLQPLIDTLLAKGRDARPVDAGEAMTLVRALIDTLPDDAVANVAAIVAQDTVAAMPTPIALRRPLRAAPRQPTHAPPSDAPPTAPPQALQPPTERVERPGPATVSAGPPEAASRAYRPPSTGSLDHLPLPPPASARSASKLPLLLAAAAAGLMALVVAGAGAWWLLRSDAAEDRTSALAATAAANGIATAGAAQTSAAQTSAAQTLAAETAAATVAAATGETAAAAAAAALPPAADIAASAGAAASAPASMTSITLVSKPLGAEVRLQDKAKGVTPLAMQIAVATTVVLHKAGFADASVELRPGDETVRLVTLTPLKREAARRRRGAKPSGTSAATSQAADGKATGTQATTAPTPVTAKAKAKLAVKEAKVTATGKLANSAEKLAEKLTAAARGLRGAPPVSGDQVAPAKVRTAHDAKRLYGAERLSRDGYRSVIQRLKLVRRDQILAAKQRYKDGKVDKAGYRALRVQIDKDYWGKK